MSLFGPCRNCGHSHGAVSPEDRCPSCDCTDCHESTGSDFAELYARVAELKRSLIAQSRELHRLQCGVPVEGDHACAASLRVQAELDATRDRATRAEAEVTRLRGIAGEARESIMRADETLDAVQIAWAPEHSRDAGLVDEARAFLTATLSRIAQPAAGESAKPSRTTSSDTWTCPGCGKVHTLKRHSCIAGCECGRLATHVEKQAQRNRNGVVAPCNCTECVDVLRAAENARVRELLADRGRLAGENETLRAEVERVTRERDAYKRAKSENDDRYMTERDAALAEARTLREERDRLAGQVERVRGLLPATLDTIDTTEDPPCCVKCGAEYMLDNGDEPTPLCHPCAHEIVAKAFAALSPAASAGEGEDTVESIARELGQDEEGTANIAAWLREVIADDSAIVEHDRNVARVTYTDAQGKLQRWYWGADWPVGRIRAFITRERARRGGEGAGP